MLWWIARLEGTSADDIAEQAMSLQKLGIFTFIPIAMAMTLAHVREHARMMIRAWTPGAAARDLR